MNEWDWTDWLLVGILAIALTALIVLYVFSQET